MKQLFLGLATLIIALFAGILAANHFGGEPLVYSVTTEHRFTSTTKSDGFRSICDLTLRDPDIGVTIALKGTLTDFESSNTKMIDLDCTANTIRVYCGESDMECKNVLADLKASEAATARVIVTGEYLEQANPGSYNRPEHRFLIQRFVEVGTVSFADEPDQSYPSIQGARDRPAKKKRGIDYSAYGNVKGTRNGTGSGSGSGAGSGSGSGTGEGIKK